MSEEYNVVLIGECGVGKSALTQQFLKGFFLEDYDPTIDDKFQKDVAVDGKKCELEIIDTAGQEAYAALRDNYLRSGEGFLLLYSVTDRTSFEKIPLLYQHLLKVKECQAVPCVLVGNKCDLDPDDRVSENEGSMMAQKLKVPFFEASAKSRENVDESFAELIRRLRQLSPQQRQQIKKPMNPNIVSPKKPETGKKRTNTITSLLRKIGGGNK